MQEQTAHRKLILASSSPYRKILLDRLGFSFEIRSPDIDESGKSEESAGQLVSRLAREKALEVANRVPSALVIGSDQLAVHGERIVGKPGSADNACRQLQEFSGQTVRFLSAVAVVCLDTAFSFQRTVETRVCFRDLSPEEIRRYVEREMPVDCAGSFKSEAGGIALFRSLESSDPTALIGLPLITVCEALRKAGLQIP
jgi:septum formation protein